jgi:hypothetical protein
MKLLIEKKKYEYIRKSISLYAGLPENNLETVNCFCHLYIITKYLVKKKRKDLGNLENTLQQEKSKQT